MPSFTLSRRHALIAVACAIAVVFIASRALTSPGGGTGADATGLVSTGQIPPLTTGSPTDPSVAPGSSSSPAVPATGAVVVDVAGAVRRPGLYRLSQGSRIADAIAHAGGLAHTADSALVNLAAPLADGEQVLVPSGAGSGSGGGSPGAGGPGAAVSGPPSPTAPVDLNSATAEQLDALPGIGPVTAQKIVDYRQEHGPFTSVDDLDAIPGIGPSRIDDLRGLVIP